MTPYLLLTLSGFSAQALLVIPIVPVLVSTGALAARGDINLGLAVLALAAGVVPGDGLWYVLGRRHGGRILSRVCRAGLEPNTCVRRAQNFLGRFGARALLIAKFVPGLSTVALPMAGAYGMLPRRFLVYDTAGVLLWCAAYVGAGYVSVRQITQAAPGAPIVDWRTVVAGVFAVLGYIAWKYYRRQRRVRRLWIDRIGADELHRRLAAGEGIWVVDLRHRLEFEAEPHTIPAALYIPAEELRERHREIPRKREVVLYCSCPDQETSVREALKLRRRGVRPVRLLEGGFDAWRDRGYPLEARGPVVAPEDRMLNAA